jgi:hypothetical protein
MTRCLAAANAPRNRSRPRRRPFIPVYFTSPMTVVQTRHE